jgi:DNA (cytosine-5)-methyltransferase 1
MKIGSLCTGYGGLDMAVEAYFDAEMVWCAENDKYASRVIEQRFNKTNLGDIKQIDWASVEPIDILTAGYPCQPFSHAGQRKGENDERHIWPHIIKGISILRPKYIILENVRGHLSLGFKEVLSDLAKNGYDARWRIIRASDVGAPHQRARLFIVAYPASKRCENQLCTEESSQSKQSITSDTNCDACKESRRANRGLSEPSIGFSNGQDERQTGHEYRCSCKTITDPHHSRRLRDVQGLSKRFNTSNEMCMQEIPNTLVDGRLNPVFVEYMMGLPIGWVTDLDLSRSQQLKMLGNGVVPQQAYFALHQLLCVI